MIWESLTSHYIFCDNRVQFKVNRLQIIVVAKKGIYQITHEQNIICRQLFVGHVASYYSINFLPINLVVALSLEEDHQRAIEVREEQTLPIYRKQLGDHPFTATILNNLSNNYYALGQYDRAQQYSDEALRMRQELLQDHRDTAKSLFDLGMVHKERGELQKANECLKRCQTIQERVLDDNIRDLERYVGIFYYGTGVLQHRV